MNHKQLPKDLRNNANKLMAKGDFKGAASLLGAVCQSGSKNPEVYYLLGICFGKLGRMTDAVQTFQQGINLRPDVAQMHFMLGVAQFEIKQFNKAAESFLSTLKLDNNIVGAHLYLAKTSILPSAFNY